MKIFKASRYEIVVAVIASSFGLVAGQRSFNTRSTTYREEAHHFKELLDSRNESFDAILQNSRNLILRVRDGEYKTKDPKEIKDLKEYKDADRSILNYNKDSKRVSEVARKLKYDNEHKRPLAIIDGLLTAIAIFVLFAIPEWLDRVRQFRHTELKRRKEDELHKQDHERRELTRAWRTKRRIGEAFELFIDLLNHTPFKSQKLPTATTDEEIPPSSSKKAVEDIVERNESFKKSLYSALEPVLGSYAGVTAKVLCNTLGEVEIKSIIENPTVLKTILSTHTESLSDAFASEGVRFSIILDLIFAKLSHPLGGREEPYSNSISGEAAKELAKIERNLELLAQLSLNHGLKSSDFHRWLVQIGFQIKLPTGKGAGHPVLYYGDNVVRGADGRPRYVPHRSDSMVKDVVLKEIVLAIRTLLESRKTEILTNSFSSHT
ncbi:MAG: hypothetical protein Q7S22_08430 [Candidatus Micrarchaeota archaeon]|nr:hypothetical protein [Candidatus Micrarchaeota archaeon]